MTKNYTIALISVALLVGSFAYVQGAIKEEKVNADIRSVGVLSDTPITPTNTINVQKNATNTIAVPKNHTILLDSEFTAQGACLKIKDGDGSGFTYLTASNGVLTASTNSCE